MAAQRMKVSTFNRGSNHIPIVWHCMYHAFLGTTRAGEFIRRVIPPDSTKQRTRSVIVLHSQRYLNTPWSPSTPPRLFMAYSYGTDGAGVIKADISQNQDWLGRSRTASGSQGAVSADHGRCSDMGVSHSKTPVPPKTYSCTWKECCMVGPIIHAVTFLNADGRCALSQERSKAEIRNNQNKPSRNLIRSQLQISSTSVVLSGGWKTLSGFCCRIMGPRIVTILLTTLNDRVALRSGLDVLKRGGTQWTPQSLLHCAREYTTAWPAGWAGAGFLPFSRPIAALRS